MSILLALCFKNWVGCQFIIRRFSIKVWSSSFSLKIWCQQSSIPTWAWCVEALWVGREHLGRSSCVPCFHNLLGCVRDLNGNQWRHGGERIPTPFWCQASKGNVGALVGMSVVHWCQRRVGVKRNGGRASSVGPLIKLWQVEAQTPPSFELYSKICLAEILRPSCTCCLSVIVSIVLIASPKQPEILTLCSATKKGET